MEEKELSEGTKIKVAVITVLVILTTLAGITYAFFSIGVTGNDEASSVTVTAALLRLTYSDNLSIGGSSIYPGWSQSKTISVENTGTDTVYYKIMWRELLNQITNDELTISATCVPSSGTCPAIEEQPISTYLSQTTNQTIKDKIGIAPNVTHTYTVTVTFKEMSSAQNYNQGKSFYGTLNIAEGKKPPIRTGNTYEGMDIIKIKNEEFYDITNVVDYSSLDSSFLELIDYDASKSILLARYNLSPTTGLQTSSTKKSDYAVPFAGSSNGSGYWYDSTNAPIIKSEYGTYTNYANNIYDTTYVTAPNYSVAFNNNAGNANYSIAYYVEQYVSNLGVDGAGRLLTYLEANAMTQNQRINGQRYWCGTAVNSYTVMLVMNSTGKIVSNDFYYPSNNGVRPVVVVSTSDIK